MAEPICYAEAEHEAIEQKWVKLSTVSMHTPRSNTRSGNATLNWPQRWPKRTPGWHKPAKAWRRMAQDRDEYRDDRVFKFRLKDLLPVQDLRWYHVWQIREVDLWHLWATCVMQGQGSFDGQVMGNVMAQLPVM